VLTITGTMTPKELPLMCAALMPLGGGGEGWGEWWVGVVVVIGMGHEVYGVWCMVCGVWCVVYGVWCMVHGAWCMVHGAWCVVHGASCNTHAFCG
jgi:hypothetical protein